MVLLSSAGRELGLETVDRQERLQRWSD